MLVGCDQVPFEAAPRILHRIGEVRGFTFGHTLTADCHRHRGHLVIRNGATCESLDELANLSTAECMSLPLLVQQ